LDILAGNRLTAGRAAVNFSRFIRLFTLKNKDMTTKIIVLSTIGLLGAAVVVHHSGLCPFGHHGNGAVAHHATKPAPKTDAAKLDAKSVAVNK
jgi:hypothetical protein